MIFPFPYCPTKVKLIFFLYYRRLKQLSFNIKKHILPRRVVLKIAGSLKKLLIWTQSPPKPGVTAAKKINFSRSKDDLFHLPPPCPSNMELDMWLGICAAWVRHRAVYIFSMDWGCKKQQTLRFKKKKRILPPHVREFIFIIFKNLSFYIENSLYKDWNS